MDISKIYESRIIDYHAEFGVKNTLPMGNMSLCRLSDDRFLVSIRQFNYAFEPITSKGKLFNDFFSDRAYHLMIVDRNFNFLKKINCENLEMFEDIRLLRFGEVIQVGATDISYGQKDYKIVCLDFSLDETSEKLNLIKKQTFPVPHEKNYIPIEDRKGVFLSDLLPNELRITSTDDIARKITQKCRGLVQYSGSSQLLRYRDGYVALVHRREKRKYVNAFAFFDKALIQCRISDEFTVLGEKSPINFCCGMVLDGEKAILPICIHDKQTNLFELPLPDFSMTARWRS